MTWFAAALAAACVLLQACASTGRECSGFEEEVVACEQLPDCGECTPIDCAFGDWQDWYTDHDPCWGILFRNRSVETVNNDCGAPCDGTMLETRAMRAAEFPSSCGGAQGCLFSDWGDWSPCGGAVTGQSSRSRTAQASNTACNGTTVETRPCDPAFLPVDCTFADWQAWSPCSSLCGPGVHERSRVIAAPASHGGSPCVGEVQQLGHCDAAPCWDQDCQLAAWSDWTWCDAGSQRYRFRSISVKATGGGQPCEDLLSEVGACQEWELQPVDCVLSQWSEWSACNKTCGVGQSMRTRSIDAEPTRGGACTNATLVELASCNEAACGAPGDCTFSDWADWSSCVAPQCGNGTAFRSRAVRTMASPGYHRCAGALNESTPCAADCPFGSNVDCAWGNWDAWTPCSLSCGGGSQQRSRGIAVAPRGGGAPCAVENVTEVGACNTQSCGDYQDGEWGAWGLWSTCSVSCGVGLTKRERVVAQQPASGLGRHVRGDDLEVAVCNASNVCPRSVNCDMTEWSDWSECDATCKGTRWRTRTLAVPETTGCDDDPLEQVQPCNPGSDEGMIVGCDQGLTPCAFGAWGEWATCTRSCSGGLAVRSRSVAQEAKNGGAPCEGDLQQTMLCNTQPCLNAECTDCRVGDWSDWGACDECGGQRTRTRELTPPNACGAPCGYTITVEMGNCSSPCQEPETCALGAYGAADCPSTCDALASTVRRPLTRGPPAMFSDDDSLFTAAKGLHAECDGEQARTVPCAVPAGCPSCGPTQDCVFAPWSDWLDMSCTGICTRSRDVATPNNECGFVCEGRLVESKECDAACDSPQDCVFAAWSDWSACSVAQGLGSTTRQRSMDAPALNGGGCEGTVSEIAACGSEPDDPADCFFANWGDWAPCSRTCGVGVQERNRNVAAAAAHGGAACAGSMSELEPCTMPPCLPRLDCEMTDWGPWGACDEMHRMSRTRDVTRPASGGGTPCDATREFSFCGVDCAWSDWEEWSACPVSCGGGQHNRSRAITQLPSWGGNPCPEKFPAAELKVCGAEACSTDDCEVSEWSDWTPCSATCGNGVQSHSRAVLHNRTAGHAACIEALVEVLPCFAGSDCPRKDCVWGDWSAMSPCSRSCGGGVMGRDRSIVQDAGVGGQPCAPLDASELSSCNDEPCPCVDGVWGDWSIWSDCSSSCGGGSHVRNRSIVNAPTACGRPPEGYSSEADFCNVDIACHEVADCLFSDWAVWGNCSSNCNGVKTRVRGISQHGSGSGAYCIGDLAQTNPCRSDAALPNECPEPVDCEISGWAGWSECTATCGRGQQQRSRMILKHANLGGADCLGALTSVQECTMQACPAPPGFQDCRYGDWTEWAGCTQCGGQTNRSRSILQHASHGGAACNPGATGETKACDEPCGDSQYCTWDNWAPWSACSAVCGPAIRSRKRYLTLTRTKPPDDWLPMEKFKAARLAPMDMATPAHHDAVQTSELLGAFAAGVLSLGVASGIARLATGRGRFGAYRPLVLGESDAARPLAASEREVGDDPEAALMDRSELGGM